MHEADELRESREGLLTIRSIDERVVKRIGLFSYFFPLQLFLTCFVNARMCFTRMLHESCTNVFYAQGPTRELTV